MKFYCGMKYVLAEDLVVETDILHRIVVDHRGSLNRFGELRIYKWYPWNGNSGPVYDFKSTLEGSCVHDLLCDWINEGILPVSLQPMADQEYYRICKKKGLWEKIARIRLICIRWFQTGKNKATERKIYTA